MKQFYYLSVRALALLSLCLLCTGASAQTTVTTVADKGTSGFYFAALCPTADVAITLPRDADNVPDKSAVSVFSVATDGAKAYFHLLGIRKSRYVVKAGQPVVIKTKEPMVLTLEEASGRSGVMWNDLICPSADTPLADFKDEHGLDENNNIYLLTNLESNGGFGFTLFTGDIMRKDNFFIVTTVGAAPTRIRRLNTRAANDFEDGDPVPFLPGEAGNDDGFMTEVTPAGPSFVRGDANGDGEVDTKDVEAISNYIVGKPVASFVMEAADVNEDSVINVLDIVGVVDIIMKR